MDCHDVVSFNFVAFLEVFTLVEFEEVAAIIVTSLSFELVDWYSHLNLLERIDSLNYFVVFCSCQNESLQYMQEQLGSISASWLVLLELLQELAADGVLLGLDEGVQEKLNGNVNVIGVDLLSQMELGMGF